MCVSGLVTYQAFRLTCLSVDPYSPRWTEPRTSTIGAVAGSEGVSNGLYVDERPIIRPIIARHARLAILRLLGAQSEIDALAPRKGHWATSWLQEISTLNFGVRRLGIHG